MTNASQPWKILSDPFRNKGTAFTEEERLHFKLHGKLPFHVSTLDEQVKRRYLNFQSQLSDLSKNLFLSSLHSRNTVLFYQLVSQHITEMLPLIYTPTIGEYSLNFSHLYTEPRGLYLSYPHKDKLDLIFSQLDSYDIDVIVITDGHRILGLGDLGVGGMAIPIGKLSLYTLFGGIHPGKTLPIVIDVGTNNPQLLNDPLYLGWKNPRLSGHEYNEFLDLIIRNIKKWFPHALLQWEDFGKEHAGPLLERYQDTICSFNDDIQGTAAVVLSALHAAVKRNQESLIDQKIIVLGGGSAGIGICKYLIGSMQQLGLSQKEALDRIFVVDIDGLLHTNLGSIQAYQHLFVKDYKEVETWGSSVHITLEEVVEVVKPSILIGVSAQQNAFNEKIIRQMKKYHRRPVIFPLSNPTIKSEAHPLDILTWTEGEVIIATGSPFLAVKYEGKTVPITQCNNAYIFPGVGLGVIACRAKKVTDTMFYKAAEILSCYSPILLSDEQTLFPSFESLRDISKEIALGVIQVAQHEGLCDKTDVEIQRKMIEDTMWYPDYQTYMS